MARNRTSRKTNPLSAGSLDPVAALAILRAEIGDKPENPVAGFLTTQGWADAWGVTREHAQRLLNRGIGGGIVDERRFRIKAGSILRKVRHFKITGKVAA